MSTLPPAQVAATIRGVIDDLSPLSQRLGPGGDAEKEASMLDQLSCELSQAARILRAGDRA
jgi:hypothetical protein